MKKKFIILVVVAITIALLGLVGIQLYWIRNAVAVKEVNFDRGVGEAVSRAVYKFNKIELARKLMMEQEKNHQMTQFFHMLDSLHSAYYNQLISGSFSEIQNLDTSNIFPRQGFEFNIRFQGSNPAPEIFDTNFIASEFPGRNPGGYLPGPDQRRQDDPFSMFFERSKIINDLFDDLFSNRYSFQVSGEKGAQTLDSLLGAELQRQGINTPYEFGVYNPAFGALVNQKTGNYPEKLLESQYVFSLFPNDIFLNPEYLLMYFPQQKRFIFSQMNAMVTTSTVLILIIISSFAFTIMTIIRQKKLSVMKNDFINNMTHELKTPISTISLACQALSDHDVQKSETLYQSYINVINEENKRLGNMTEKVLQTALIDKGRIRLNITGLDVHEIIKDAISKIGLQVKANHGEIIEKLDAEYSFIEADKVHLTNVVFNLLDNANKSSPTSPRIVVSTENTSKGILVHVQDNGVGINRADQKKIFDNLYRVSTGNIHDVKGFGLGLSYVKAITEQHGGYVTLESEPKKGSRFSIFIPFGFNGHGNDSKK